MILKFKLQYKSFECILCTYSVVTPESINPRDFFSGSLKFRKINNPAPIFRQKFFRNIHLPSISFYWIVFYSEFCNCNMVGDCLQGLPSGPQLSFSAFLGIPRQTSILPLLVYTMVLITSKNYLPKWQIVAKSYSNRGKIVAAIVEPGYWLCGKRIQ